LNTSNQSKVRVIKPKSNVKVISSLVDRDKETTTSTRKGVCAYCRVSTDQEEQQSSYDLQIAHYTDLIMRNRLWKFSGIYADEGISGTSIKNRTEFLRMIEDCKNGNIDMIITKSISRLSRKGIMKLSPRSLI